MIKAPRLVEYNIIQSNSPEQNFKRIVSLPFLDRFKSQLVERFINQNAIISRL